MSSENNKQKLFIPVNELDIPEEHKFRVIIMKQLRGLGEAVWNRTNPNLSIERKAELLTKYLQHVVNKCLSQTYPVAVYRWIEQYKNLNLHKKGFFKDPKAKQAITLAEFIELFGL